MPEAVFSVGPMPEPVSRYQGPFCLAMSMPAAFQSCSSAKCVPLLSPREANAALLWRILFKAATISLLPPIPAGSDLGPTRMKSLYITSKRLTP